MGNPSASEPGELQALKPGIDHFERLGLEARFELSRDDIEERYLALSKLCHPDRFATATASQRRLALEHTAALNEAYETLRGSVRRAEYLVKLGGIDLDSSDPQGGAPTPTQPFLLEMIEAREQLDSLSSSGDDDGLDQYRDEVEARLERSLEAALRALTAGDIAVAARELVARRYHQRLLDEVEDCLDRE